MIRIYAMLALLIVFMAGVIYIQHLQKENKELTTELANTKVLLAAAENQVQQLAIRDTKTKKVEKSYEKARSEIKNKQNGPVAPVLRYAIDTDVVQ